MSSSDSLDRQAIFRRIAADAEKRGPVFSTHADVALRVRRALDDPNCSIDQAAKLIRAEPLLTARIVATANSVVYSRGGNELTDIKQAVARIGFRTVRSLATALVVRQMSGGPHDPKLKAMAAQLWEHSAHVAALAHVIARRVTHMDAESALFVGIVHEVGGFYLLSRAHDFPGLLDGDPAELAAAWSGENEALVGRAVLKTIGLPAAATQALETYWQGYLALPPVSLGDTLLLADNLSPVASPLLRASTADDPADANRHSSIDVALGEGMLSGILQESADEVNSLTAALQF